jgi:hypothetical protein
MSIGQVACDGRVGLASSDRLLVEADVLGNRVLATHQPTGDRASHDAVGLVPGDGHPAAIPFPDVNAPMQPSDSPAPFGRSSGLPLPTAYLGADASSVRSHVTWRRPDVRASAGARRVGE